MSSPMAIDVHAHAAPRDMLERICATGTSRPPSYVEVGGGVAMDFGGKGSFGPIPNGIHDLEVRLADMDRQGVDIQVVAVAPILYGNDQSAEVGAGIARAINDSLVDMAEQAPGRLVVSGSLPMQDVDASLEELDRISRHERVRALQIGTHVDGRNLDEPELEPLWAAISRSGMAVLIHPSHVAGAERLRRYHMINLVGNPNDSTIAIASLILGGVLERHPMRIVFVHGGGFAPYQIGRWDHGWRARADARAASDQAPSTTLGGCFFDSLTHDDRSLRFLGGRMGWDHVLLGSDYPFDMAETEPVVALRRLGLDAEDERRVLVGNARMLLGLDEAEPVTSSTKDGTGHG